MAEPMSRDELRAAAHRTLHGRFATICHADANLGCNDRDAVDTMLTIVDAYVAGERERAKAEALREWISEWPTTPGDGTFLGEVARDGLGRADRIARGGGSDG
jgi:hypothetical protein